METAKLIFAASEHSADLLYACGFSAPDPFVYFESGKTKGIVLSALEYDRGVAECRKDITVFRIDQFTGNPLSGKTELIKKIAERFAIKQFQVPFDFPFGLGEQLRQEGLDITFAEKSFFPERRFKTFAETDRIFEALRLTSRAMDRAIEIIAGAQVSDDGSMSWNGHCLTSELLRSEINIELIRGGGFSDSTIVACGIDASQPHNRGLGPLKAGQPIVIDIFPRMADSGYWGDMTRTFVKGRAPVIVRRAFDAVLEARESSKTLIQAGAIPADIHNHALGILNRHGFPTGKNQSGDYGFFHSLGHGVGLEIHEAPRLSAANSEPLQGGEVVTVEPGVYYPEWGGVRLEDVVAVTGDGCKCLTEADTFLEID